MRKVFVLFILALGAIQASEVQASEGSPVGEAGQTYLVRPRDRFETLATRFGVTPEEIRAANPRAYGIRCLRPFKREGRDGEQRAYCGRPRYYLIAGKTLVIPTPRLIVESENVRLDAENIATQAELDRANQARDSLEEERNALRAERDDLERTNEATLRAKAELQARYDELKQAGAASPVPSGKEEANNNGQTPPGTYGQEGFWTAIGVLLASVLFVSILILYRRFGGRSEKKAPEPSEEIRKERENLETTRKALAREGQDLAERRRQLEADEQKIGEERIALDKERESLRTQRDELGRWEESLRAREVAPAPEKPRVATVIGVPPIFPHVPTGTEKTRTEAGLLQVMVARGRQLLEEEIRTLAGREAACKAREEAVGRRADKLGEEEGKLLLRDKELCDKARSLEELRGSLNSQKAKQDRKDLAQEERERNLVQGFADMATQQRRVQSELDAKRSELDRRASDVDAKVRMYDEDIAPAIEKARKELAAREAALAERERGFAETERSNTERAEKLSEDERAYERRLRELNDAVGALDERAEKLGEGERKLGEEQLELQNNREAFTNEVDAAKSTLARAKRKKEIVAAFDARESAVARREGECDTREGALEAWEERLTAREGLPRIRGPHRPTLQPPPLQLSPIGGSSGDAGDDDTPTLAVMPGPPEGDVDPSGLTYIDPPGSEPAVGMSKCLCAHCGQEIPLGGEEEHKPNCPEQRDAPSGTGSQIPAAAQAEPGSPDACVREDGREVPLASPDAHRGVCVPAPEDGATAGKPAHGTSGVYCGYCKRLVSLDEYEAKHREHDRGLPKLE
jgi:hypothetical protein